MTTNLPFKFHSDPAHGWIKVPLADMRDAKLEPKDFSRYSYRDRNTFYLEEDCDAPKFIDAWQKATGLHAEFVSVLEDGPSFIRNLPSIHA